MRLETEAAIRAAGIAQRIADARAGAGEVMSKGGIDLVTGSDVACEDAIRAELSRAFPQYPVIGEERGGDPVPGKPYWLVDPICGTRCYASNVPLYCTNIAWVDGGEVLAAAIGIGKTGEIIFAEKGNGAMMRTAAGEQRISVSPDSNTIWIDGKPARAADFVRSAMLQRRWYVWQFSTTLSYAYVAMGKLSAAIQFAAPHPPYGSVHAAAGCFVAKEAGAIVTDIDTGEPWTLQSSSYLMAATPDLQRELNALITLTTLINGSSHK